MNKRTFLYFCITLSLLGGMLLAPKLVAGSPGLSADPAIPAEAWQSVLAHIPVEGPILHADEPGDGDWFGHVVAIDGDTLVVGAYQKDTEDGVHAGAAYVFERNEGGPNNWGQVIVLQASNADDISYFGHSVAISGDTVVVGADGANGEDAGGAPIFDAGAAYVFERNGDGPNNWGEVAILYASDAYDYDGFGYSVAISGDTLVVGADTEDGESEDAGFNCGAAYVFERDEGNPNVWDEADILHASDAQGGDNFGRSVAISGNTLVVGAYAEDTGGDYAGAAYVFERDPGNADNWNQILPILHASDAEAGDYFGSEVAISGDTLVVGAHDEDTGGDNAGAAYVFERNEAGPNNWGEVTILYASNPGEYDRFGLSVAISGDTLIVGAWMEDGEAGDPGFNAGAAYVFERNEGNPNTWDETAILRASDAQQDDQFGSAVAISGDTLGVGASWEDGVEGDQIDDSGAVYLFLPPIDLSLSKAVTPLSAEPGQSITYTLAFSNTGESIAHDVFISDTLPVSLTLTDITSSVPITDTGATPPYVWKVDDLGFNVGGTITITSELTRCLSAGQIFTNIATIASTTAGGLEDVNLANNSSAVDVTVLNAAPMAVDDAYIATEGSPLVVNAPEGVLANDDDANCDSLTAALDLAPASGDLDLDADGSFIYAPPPGFSEAITFTYTAFDAIASSNTATVTITPNISPDAVDDEFTAVQNTPRTLDVLANDSDPDGGSLTITVVGEPDQAGAVVNDNNLLTYTPAAGFLGVETFTYTLSDGQGGFDTATVIITVVQEMDAYPVYLPLVQKDPAD